MSLLKAAVLGGSAGCFLCTPGCHQPALPKVSPSSRTSISSGNTDSCLKKMAYTQIGWGQNYCPQTFHTVSPTWALPLQMSQTAKTSPQRPVVLTSPTTIDVPRVLAPIQLVPHVFPPLIMWSQGPLTTISLFVTLLFIISQQLILD